MALLPLPCPPGLPSGSSWAPWQSNEGPYKALKNLIQPLKAFQRLLKGLLKAFKTPFQGLLKALQ